MFKLIFTMKKKFGTSADDFMRYYEEKHLPFLAAMLLSSDKAPKVQRNYVRPDDPFLKVIGDGRADFDPPFDALTEVVFDIRGEAEALMKALFTPQYLEPIKQDEENFVDPSSIKFYVVEVCGAEEAGDG